MIDLRPILPTCFRFPWPAMPTTSVAKINGAMMDLMRRRKMELSGLRVTAAPGASHPTVSPIAIPMKIHCVREGRTSFMEYGGFFLPGDRGSHAPLLHFSEERSPEEVDRDAGEHDQESGPGVLGLKDQEVDGNGSRRKNVQSREEWISKCLVRALGVRLFLPEKEDSDHGEDIKDEHGKDHVIEEIAIGAREAEHARPDRLDPERHAGNAVAV